MPLDRSRLLKLMMMTTSTNDGEALNALRKANAMLKAEGQDWSSLLGLSAALGQRPAPRPPVRPMGRGTSEAAARYNVPQSRFTDKEIPRMLQSLLRDTKGDFKNVVVSWNEFWHNKGYLTERQYESLINAYERAQ